MRYYSLILNTSVAEIKENARVNLKDSEYVQYADQAHTAIIISGNAAFPHVFCEILPIITFSSFMTRMALEGYCRFIRKRSGQMDQEA